ncbi:DUF6344 domain-containing protein [Streptomyces sp. NPDC088812]|uniref:DUF6344 domain-containing protein n=1 Tax=Streptomyces sp. NPDC088812 TaxID=3365905 RepID=UPI0038224933
MTENRVMKLWTAIVTAFFAVCAALGFITTTATTAVAQTEPARNSDNGGRTVHPAVPAVSPWAWLHARSLPPTMKQRIRAEAHGKSPSCRTRPLPEADPAEPATEPATEPAAGPEAAPGTGPGEPAEPFTTSCEPEALPRGPKAPIPLQR